MVQKKRITVATTISADGTVKAGGTNVMYGLYTGLANYYDVSLVFIAPVQYLRKKIEICDGLVQFNIPRSVETDKKIKELAHAVNASTLYDLGLLFYLSDTPTYEDVLRREINLSDIVMVDRPYLYDVAKKLANGRPIIHRSHNIEYYFKKANIPKSLKGTEILNSLFDTEMRCCQGCELNFSCSELDIQMMNDKYNVDEKKQKFIANGIDIEEVDFTTISNRKKKKNNWGLKGTKLAVFIGGGHKPNVEACEEIIKASYYCPEISFVIAGNVCDQVAKMNRPNNIILLGLISEKTRNHLFSLADVALNPMFSGSGANVKMIDYMASGIPVISTHFGARGIIDKSGILFADTTSELIRVLSDFSIDYDTTIDAVCKNREMVEKYYDWKEISYSAYEYIESIMK